MSFISQRPEGLIKLGGTIRNYKVTRASANFVFTDSDKTKLGVVAIAAGIAGLSGQAISTASSANAEEEADYVEFELDGQPIKGWVWRSPFKEGDVVEVAAEWQDGHYEAGGILRSSDRTIALYPHCSRGWSRHVKNAIRWWFVGVTTLLLVSVSLVFIGLRPDQLARFFSSSFPAAALCLYVFFAVATFSMARKWMVFVRLAEKVFRILGLPDPSNIDLVKSSKAQRKPDDPGEYGTFYFRY